MRKIAFFLIVVVGLVVFTLVFVRSRTGEVKLDVASTNVPATALPVDGVSHLERDDGSSNIPIQGADEVTSPEEEAVSAEEAKVDAFDGLTDKWMEPAKTGVTMKDVEEFVKAFRQVPKARQDECIHRALNLVPDENVMLLVGVLMDKSMDKEIVETVFNDILNRDEDVKNPILQQIFKDKTHPCFEDAAWILDVTGETPTGKK